MNCVYKPCPAALYSAVQSCCSILSHDTLHHCLSSNSSLENSEREQGHLSRYYSNHKNTSRIVFRERAYSATGNSRVHYLKSGYVIQLIAFRWDKACIHSSPFPLLRKWVWLARLTSYMSYSCLLCYSQPGAYSSYLQLYWEQHWWDDV